MNRFEVSEGRIHGLLPKEEKQLHILQGTYDMQDCEVDYAKENDKKTNHATH
ncbi:MAG: hypothetical protein SPL05_07435 [Eubacteriales bacterium]|nr:hypothetical protein [Eubacteriales bacterium]